MKVARINEFRAKEGKAEALRSFLTPGAMLSRPSAMSIILQDNLGRESMSPHREGKILVRF